MSIRCTESLTTFLAPMTPETFLRDYHTQKPVHIVGDRAKFTDVFSWEHLSALLNQTTIWTFQSLELVLDNRKLDASEYCVVGQDRANRSSMVPDFDKVASWLRRGASMICNDVDSLTDGLKAISTLLEHSFTAKVQGNLYCSWKAHQGFGSHFDTHDVYAVHIAGEKTWRLYQRYFEDPIAHPTFRTLGHEFHQAHRGPLSEEVTLKPGDILYIPRGWYHDALATSQATFHVAFGVSTVIGLDVMTLLFDRVVQEPLFRKTLPESHGEKEEDPLLRHLALLGDHLKDLTTHADTVHQIKHSIQHFSPQRPTIRLPDDALTVHYRRRTSHIEVFQHKDAWMIGSKKKAVAIPPGLEQPVSWMVERNAFSHTEFAEQFPALAPDERTTLIDNMIKMKVLEIA